MKWFYSLSVLSACIYLVVDTQLQLSASTAISEQQLLAANAEQYSGQMSFSQLLERLPSDSDLAHPNNHQNAPIYGSEFTQDDVAGSNGYLALYQDYDDLSEDFLTLMQHHGDEAFYQHFKQYVYQEPHLDGYELAETLRTELDFSEVNLTLFGIDCKTSHCLATLTLNDGEPLALAETLKNIEQSTWPGMNVAIIFGEAPEHNAVLLFSKSERQGVVNISSPQ
ncbi:hypothetical protein [Motilimonas pumila]|uniref:Uncharacterized protein n=1 Tax=Motilimonas pumila TaxID=2303987 RepID=A0A418YK69_9GAMM|nr:hypothetical protein [Motilimonas pumila]RJG51356.1 hypothetical protein D1Z90_01070 [Motilimonas pumila]